MILIEVVSADHRSMAQNILSNISTGTFAFFVGVLMFHMYKQLESACWHAEIIIVSTNLLIMNWAGLGIRGQIQNITNSSIHLRELLLDENL